MKLFSLFKKQALQTVEVGSYQLQIPKQYLWEHDEEGTLLFYPKGAESITIRVTVLSFDTKDGNQHYASQLVKEEAIEKGFHYETLEKHVVLSESPVTESSENDTDINMQFWYLGRENSYIMFSACTVAEQEDSDTVKAMQGHLPYIFRSVSPA